MAINRLCEGSFWKIIIISFNSVWALEMIGLLLKNLPIFEDYWSSHKFFLLITLRNWQSVTNILSPNAWLTNFQTPLVYWKRHVIIFNSFSKIWSFVFTSPSCICGIDMIRVYIKHSSEIINSFLNLTQLFICTPPDIECSSIPRINIPFFFCGRLCDQLH